MQHAVYYLVALPMGFALGSLFFGGLWLTIQQLPTTQQPFRLFMASYLGRMAIALVGIYWITDGHWIRALVCLLGFTIARFFFIQRLEPRPYQD